MARPLDPIGVVEPPAAHIGKVSLPATRRAIAAASGHRIDDQAQTCCCQRSTHMSSAHPPHLSTAAAHPAPEPHGEEPPPIAARSRWCRCRACAEARALPALPNPGVGGTRID
jgi:hypothetical protein